MMTYDGSLFLPVLFEHILAFYRGLVDYRIIDPEILTLAFEDRELLLSIKSGEGVCQLLRITSSDLAIKAPSSQPDPEKIYDGGALSPISKQDQEIIIHHLKKSHRCIYLIFAVALLTGARLQTVCTLRIESIKNGIRDDFGNLLVKVGGETKVDTKKKKKYKLIFKKELIEAINIYTESPVATERRGKSFYGNSDENYIFINHLGEPYYTSNAEKRDRKNAKMHYLVGLNSGMTETRIKNGKAIQKYVSGILLPRIRNSNPDFPAFRFHDLRATFGMNLLEDYMTYIDKHNQEVKQKGGDNYLTTQWVLEKIKGRMGHSNIQTTMGYLDFKHNNAWQAQLQNKIEELVLQNIPLSVDFDDDKEL